MGELRPKKNKKPHVKLVDGAYPFSVDNLTAEDFWIEYKHGTNGIQTDGRSLESLEKEYGCRWRSPKMYHNNVLVQNRWIRRNALYKFIQQKIDDGESEKRAVKAAQAIFQERLDRSKDKSVSDCRDSSVLLC